MIMARGWVTRVVVSVVVTMVMAGCTSLKGRADDALATGRYLEAAELYDGVLARSPGDREAIARRTQARQAVLHALLVATHQRRIAGDLPRASEQLDELLARRSQWGTDVARADEQWLTMEAVALGDAVDAAVEHAITTSGPLRGEAIATLHAKLLAHRELASWRRAITERVMQAGRRQCTVLAADARTPYWTWIVATYCAHFGDSTVARLPLPHLRRDLTIEGEITGAPASDAAHAALATAFRGSVWYGPTGAPGATAVLAGTVNAAFSRQFAPRTATWTESIPYTDYETTQESYEEPYEDSESYTEQVPYTEYQTRTEPCGETSCTRTEPVTVYRSETKYRTVTRYRTRFRSVTNPVVRYRDETRDFSYQVTEITAHYVSALRVQIDEPTLPTTAAVTADFVASGIAHDVTHAEAGVRPEHTPLMTMLDFFHRESQRLAGELGRQLDASYAAMYCSAATYTIETAAACFYLNPAAPAAARAMLRTMFGADERALGSVVRR